MERIPRVKLLDFGGLVCYLFFYLFFFFCGDWTIW